MLVDLNAMTLAHFSQLKLPGAVSSPVLYG
jgi:hypothetical protein